MTRLVNDTDINVTVLFDSKWPCEKPNLFVFRVIVPVNNIIGQCQVCHQTSVVLSWFIDISVCVYRVTNWSPFTVCQIPSGKNGTVLNSVDTKRDGDRLEMDLFSQLVKYTPLSSVTHTSYVFIADIFCFITFEIFLSSLQLTIKHFSLSIASTVIIVFSSRQYHIHLPW